MNRDSANNIVDLELVEHRNGKDNNRTADTTDEERCPHARSKRFCRDRNQACECAVQRHGNIDFLVKQLGHDDGNHYAGSSRHVGIGEDA